ncbi:MAG: glycogen synthase [Lachnospirales bacterium]
MEQTKILLLASEMTPFVSSGGLGEVIGSLPKSLGKNNIDVRVIIPKYKEIKETHLKDLNFVLNTSITLNNERKELSVFSKKYDDYTVYFIENHQYFSRDSLYAYYDDFERFAFFSRAALEILPLIEFQPNILHLNDWQTALCPIYLDKYYKKFTFYKNIKTLMTIHNIRYQGNFGADVLYRIGLDYSYFTIDKLEFYGNINYLKGALKYADAISTVSPTYAKEIQSQEFAYGLEGILQERQKDIYGILNGVDIPNKNPVLSESVDKILDHKKAKKLELQKRLGLDVTDDVPLIAIISRLVDQKGLSLISHEVLNRNIQLVVLGTGDGHFEHYFRNLQEVMPNKISANIYYEKNFSDELYFGADMFLMPSLFEPCGLGQIFALENGTIPIVRSTGGLKDTVIHYSYETREGNGFVFEDFLTSGLAWGLDEALNCYYNKENWKQIVSNALNTDYSWDKSSIEYIKLYEKIINNK